MVIFERITKIKKWEYEKDRIPYIDENGIQRNTIPDFHLYWTNGSEEIIEYKPRWKMKFKREKIKIKAMQKYTKEKNYKFRVLTETNLVKWKDEI